VPAGGSRQTFFQFLELIGWTVAAFVGAIVITQAFGWTGLMPMAIVQSLTPYLGLLLAPIALIALWRRRLRLVAVCGAIGLGLLVLAAPLAYPDRQPDAITGAVGLRVASVNLLYSNDRIDDVVTTLHDLAPDVIVFNEYTAEHQSSLQGSTLADDYRYRIDRTDEYAGGIAVWSREPVTLAEAPDTYNHSLDATVEGPDGDVRLVALHIPTPLISFENWQHDLHTVGRIGRDATTPTAVVGDLNSSYWHPDFRRLLDVGFVDAHIANGKGFSASWPTDMIGPAFVRLDHALTTGGLVSTDVVDFEIPGSDHLGFVVTVAPTP
jgi:endonuclease/exonuclease/phosphatase (EEP) superfamily protein YafD